MAHTITRIRDTNEFMTAVSVKQRIEACLAVFIKRVLPTGGVGRASAVERKYDYDGKRLTPRMISELNQGDDVEVVNPSGQSADAASFIKLHQKMIGAGQGMILAGRVSIPDFWEKKEEYFEHEWIKKPKPWIDPMKEASATKTALNSGVKTYKQVAAENGMDWRAQIDDTAEVLEYARKKGIDLGGVLFDGKLQEEKEEEPKASDAGSGEV